MTHLIETDDGEIFEVSTLFADNGCVTEHVYEAVSCVIKFDENLWQATEIMGRPIHRLQ